MAGAMRLVITSDTHVPKRAKDLPPALWSAIERADVVIHAGDWVDVALLDAFEARTRGRLIGVFGNNDGPELRARLPEVAEADLDGVQIAVVHDSGPATRREERCSRQYTGKNVLIFGHSHIPWDTTAASGLRLLNPGSPTDRRRQPHATFMTAIVDAGALTRVELHRFARREPG